MIISHKHKFIFIKTKKTAGTSIEIALSKLCSSNDIITPISPEDELLRKKLDFKGPQNYNKKIIEYNLKDILKILIKHNKPKLFFNHMSAVDVKKIVGENIWMSYYKFCFERNPWDKLLSLYYWENRANDNYTLEEFFRRKRYEVLRNKGGWGLYTDSNDNIIVDKVYKYEEIDSALSNLQEKFKLNHELVLYKTKAKYRPMSCNNSTIFTPTQNKIIENIFVKEISLFNYHNPFD